MPWSETLRDWAFGPATGKPGSRVASQLVGLVSRLLGQAQQLDSHAELAPNEHADRELRRLSTEMRAGAERLRQALVERGLPVPESAFEAPAATGPSAASHWARLVQDLDETRALHAMLVGLTGALGEADAGLDSVIGDTIATAGAQLSGLRGLIARADPQALN